MRWLAVDPGETTGYSIWEDSKFIDGGQEPLWDFAHAVWDGLTGDFSFQESAHISTKLHGCQRIVCEDFRIYPEIAHAGGLDWDQVRTARLIGALTFMSRLHSIEFKLQGANIKSAAEAAGASAFYSTPLHPNRHQNDSVQHAVYYLSRQVGAKPVIERHDTAKLITDNS